MLLRMEGRFSRKGGVLKKRGRTLKKVCLVRATRGGRLGQKGGGLLKKGVRVLKNPVPVWRSWRSWTPSRRPSPCPPWLIFLPETFLKVRVIIFQALPRRRLVRRRLVSGNGVYVPATFSRPEHGRTAKSLTEVHSVLVFPVFFKRRLEAAPLTLTQGALKQPNNGGTRAPVTNDLVLTGGLALHSIFES